MNIEFKKGRKEKRPLLISALITSIILLLLIFSGPATALSVLIQGLMSSYTQDSIVKFNVTINISGPDKFVPAKNIYVNLTGKRNISRTFDLNGKPLPGGDEIIKVTPISKPNISSDFGYGYGYAFYGYGYDFGYGYGYGYDHGRGNGTLLYKYRISINTSTLEIGNYSAIANLKTTPSIGINPKDVFSSDISPFKVIDTINIITKKINVRSNASIEVAILSSEGFNSSFEINKSTIRFGPSRKEPSNITDNKEDVDGNGFYDLIVEFHNRGTGIECGMTSATLTAMTYDGVSIDGSDTIETLGCEKEKGKSSANGNSTGGLGITTPEPLENIEKYETVYGNLLSGEPVTIRYTTPDLWISELVITGKESENDAGFRLELLKGLSRRLNVPAPGTKYFNVWEGTGFGVQEGLIRFKVANSWILSEGIISSDAVKMYLWDGGKWSELITTLISKDDTNSYYEAKTNTLGHLAITGTKTGPEAPVKPEETQTAGGPAETTPAEAPATGLQPTSLVYIIIVIAVIGIAAFLYVTKWKK